MSYTSQTFTHGQTLTADHMNNIINGIDEALSKSSSSGGSSTDTLLGQTPLQIDNDTMIKLTCDGDCAYSIMSHTVANFDIAEGTVTKASLEVEGDYYKLMASSDAASWYSSNVVISVSGLTVGNEYSFIFDASGIPYDYANRVTIGHFILYDADGNTLVTRDSSLGAVRHSYPFTATTDSVKIYWYPSPGDIFSAGVSTAYVKSMYINRGENTTHTDIIDLSGAFSGSISLGSIAGGVTISSDPVCNVYESIIAESTAQTRHTGKTCVCFGDSITGNMDAPYDYPSVLASETGMTVVNAGFGGCRMSDTHPTECYAAFSMVKLVDAIIAGDWTTQEGLVSEMSESTNASERLSNLQKVDWEDVDFVSIAYGTNDINAGVVLENDTLEDTSTILGAMHYSIHKLMSAFPHLKFMVLTPIYRIWLDENEDSDTKTFTNFSGATFSFEDVVSGMCSHAQGQFKIPVCDLYRTSGINKYTYSHYLQSDGVHPNADGLKLIAGKIAGYLLSEY